VNDVEMETTDNAIENNICDEPEPISSSNNCNMLDSWITNITTTSTPKKRIEEIRDSTPSDKNCSSSTLSNTSTMKQFLDKVTKDEKLKLDSMLAKAIYKGI